MRITDAYDISRPVAQSLPKVINTVADISAILKDEANYKAYQSIMFEKTAARFSALSNVYVCPPILGSPFVRSGRGKNAITDTRVRTQHGAAPNCA